MNFSFFKCAFVVFSVLIFLSCSQLQYGAGSTNFYKKFVERWHRTGFIKKDTEGLVAEIDAVFLSCPLRLNMLNYMAKKEGLSSLETELEKEQELTECQAYYDFLVAIYTKNSYLNDLNSFSSIWKILLVADEVKEKPENITLINLKGYEKYVFYPFIKRGMKVYRVRFRRAGISYAEKLTIIMISFVGRVELNWDLI